MAKPVTELLRTWIAVHEPAADASQRTLLAALLNELDGTIDVPE